MNGHVTLHEVAMNGHVILHEVVMNGHVTVIPVFSERSFVEVQEQRYKWLSYQLHRSPDGLEKYIFHSMQTYSRVMHHSKLVNTWESPTYELCQGSDIQGSITITSTSAYGGNCEMEIHHHLPVAQVM